MGPREVKADLPPAPAGWRVDQAWFVEDTSIDGCAARRVRQHGRCARPECRRRLDVDFAMLSQVGFGRADSRDVRNLYECRRPGGCGLKWEPEQYPGGVPLAALFKPQGGASGVVIACGGCKASKWYGLTEIAKLLIRVGTGDAGTGTLELPSKIRGPCRACGRHAWSCLIVRDGASLRP